MSAPRLATQLRNWQPEAAEAISPILAALTAAGHATAWFQDGTSGGMLCGEVVLPDADPGREMWSDQLLFSYEEGYGFGIVYYGASGDWGDWDTDGEPWFVIGNDLDAEATLSWLLTLPTSPRSGCPVCFSDDTEHTPGEGCSYLDTEPYE